MSTRSVVPPARGIMTREEARSLALHNAIARRLLDNPDEVLARAHSNLAVMRKQHPSAVVLLREWKELLAGPLAGILAVLADSNERACELRHVTPFGGVLSARERTMVYREFAQRAQTP